MANQFRPWDMPGLNFRNPSIPPGISGTNNFIQNSVYTSNPTIGRPQAPPVLPPRPATNPSVTNYSSFSSPYSNYGLRNYSTYGGLGGYGGYGGYSPYSSFGGYGFGSPGYGFGSSAYPENRFIQIAEESSRPAFQSIQSVLQAFSSVTMMFESTFHAIHSSYMSVLGVADNFGKLRSVFGQIFSTFAIIRTLNWMFRKLLYLIGIQKENPVSDHIWSEALNEAAGLTPEQSQGGKTFNWPMMMIVGLITAGPYLLFKLISQLHSSIPVEVWNPAEQPGNLAVGFYDFHAASDQELSFSAQQKLMIAPKKFQPTNCPGWLLACNENRKIGLIPNNYVGIMMQSEKTGQTYIDFNGQAYPTNPTTTKHTKSENFEREPAPSTSSTAVPDSNVELPNQNKDVEIKIESEESSGLSNN